MANDPQYAAYPVVGSAVVSATADTSYTAPTNSVTLLSGNGPRQVTDGVTTNTSTTATSATIAAGTGDWQRPVSGTGIPVGTVISTTASRSAATSLTLSQPATASGSSLTFTLAGGAGTSVQEIRMQGTGTTLAGVINTYLYDSSVYHFHDSFLVTAVTPSTTTAPFQLIRTYNNLWIPPGWTLVATSFVASQLINVVASGLNC